jgi:2'-hydroxyisoflavone reductase
LTGAGGAAGPTPVWIDEARLVEMKVTPWTGLPMWIPGTFDDMRGFMEVDCTKARRSGLRTRPLAATIADTAAWLAQRDNTGAWKDVLRADAEREVLAQAPPAS